MQDMSSLRRIHVQRNAPFVEICEEKEAAFFRVRIGAGEGSTIAGRVSRSGRFNLDDIRAQFGQDLGTERSRDQVAPFNNPDAVKGAPELGIGWRTLPGICHRVAAVTRTD